MTYTKGRIVNDADSHTMETQDWLAPYLEGEYKEMYSQVYSKREGGDRIVKMKFGKYANDWLHAKCAAEQAVLAGHMPRVAFNQIWG